MCPSSITPGIFRQSGKVGIGAVTTEETMFTLWREPGVDENEAEIKCGVPMAGTTKTESKVWHTGRSTIADMRRA